MGEGGVKTVNLLLVEDDNIDAMSVQRALRKAKIINPLFRARDGEEALDILWDGSVPRPVLILLDLNMPRMGGLEFLRELRQDPALHSLVVFVLTTSDDKDDKFAAYEEHVAGYIVKHRTGRGFEGLTEVLGAYWRVVEMA
jgi:CheY-like chemotaxis protein